MRMCFFFLFVVLSFRINAQQFNPPLRMFKGYIHEVWNADIYFMFFSSKRNAVLDFKYDKTDKSFTWNDSNVVIVYYGTHRPGNDELNDLYHNVKWHDFYKTTPLFKKYNRVKNLGDSTMYYMGVSKKVYFTAYDYLDYEPYEKRYGKLISFVTYAKGGLLPDVVKFNRPFFVVNYFGKLAEYRRQK